FDPSRDVRQCAVGQDEATCLTPAQSTALSRIYSGVMSNGRRAHFGQPVGAEAVGQSPVGSVAPESGWD
ncbi:hypothetical protein, partial [Acinetobacter baumannii]|uniref:hypothetical protein n=1 Tax=Acinetobacter baumannii TaxID=470 RepID=UPI001C09C447